MLRQVMQEELPQRRYASLTARSRLAAVRGRRRFCDDSCGRKGKLNKNPAQDSRATRSDHSRLAASSPLNEFFR